MRKTKEGVPIDPLAWVEQDWKDLHEATDDAIRRIAARHAAVMPAEPTDPRDGLLAACEEGLRLAEIAVRQGLDFNRETTEEIVASHPSLVQIRAAIKKAKAAAKGT